MTTIAELAAEFVAQVKTAPTVGEKAYSTFNTDDLETIAVSPGVGFPVAGISYEGSTPIEHSAQSKASTFRSTQLISVHFLLIVANTYKYASAVDEKPTITDLLDEVRQIMMGYRGVNSRPWVYTGELPLETSLEGVIMYGQMWETLLPVVGNSPT